MGVLPAATHTIPAPHLVIPATPFVIPAKAGTHGGGVEWGSPPPLLFPRRREPIPLLPPLPSWERIEVRVSPRLMKYTPKV